MKKMVFAHRGCSGTHPENTMAAIHAAIEADVDGIEIDVQKAKDGTLVVMHDEAVDRTTNGKGLIKDLTWDELNSLDAGGWFSPKFKGEKVPAFDEVLEALKGTSIILNVEMKNDLIDYPDLEQDVYESLKRFGLEKQVVISSFNHRSLSRFSKMFPEVELAILSESPLQNPKESMASIGAAAIHCPLEAYREMLMKEEGKGLHYRIYTMNSPTELGEWGIQDQYDVFTDYPLEALKIVRE
ncbi:glycerophosphodiester phosphodiesterase [Falsibacillus albus]|uniref:Glycerophosphodiester phosphodiesterase n=1 Tax=Falsibacillus albus TaxID=2478915 RepID=A0A3L7JU44_9BACI|nr:glycerophosphodiester phosphodiesterase [Falsibacillus albus]RLQ94040.1 glycerophosphodiester phosphodiesterase [Falsibacillus albus]